MARARSNGPVIDNNNLPNTYRPRKSRTVHPTAAPRLADEVNERGGYIDRKMQHVWMEINTYGDVLGKIKHNETFFAYACIIYTLNSKRRNEYPTET